MRWRVSMSSPLLIQAAGFQTRPQVVGGMKRTWTRNMSKNVCFLQGGYWFVEWMPCLDVVRGYKTKTCVNINLKRNPNPGQKLNKYRLKVSERDSEGNKMFQEVCINEKPFWYRLFVGFEGLWRDKLSACDGDEMPERSLGRYQRPVILETKTAHFRHFTF